MTFAAGLVLIAAVIAVVGWPFFRKAAMGSATPEPVNPGEHWERQKAEAYGAIKDAEFDFQTGKMSDADFHFVRDKYAARALEAIAALERARPTAGAATPPSGVRFLFCPECGSKLAARGRFCPGCGRSLDRATDAA